MNNYEVARILWEMGDLLELRDGNRFKVVAYRKAARSAETMKDDIEEVWREGELETIPGVGKAIAKKIEEYLETGKMETHDRLVEETPPGLVELLLISGLGPKTISRLHKKLGVSSIDELEKAAREHRVRRLPRMGATSEANILKAIDRYKKRSSRIPLSVAIPIAEEVLAYLKGIEGVERLSTAGSFRRGRETVGDIDVLATSSRPGDVMRAFVKMPMVEDVLVNGSTKTSVIVNETVQVDLRIVDSRSFGTVLQYFTGSKDHNVKLRGIALQKGYSLSEYSLTRLSDQKELFFEREEDVYARLGLPYIPPEIREDEGEIEAAMADALPKLIECSEIRGDLHVHSDWSDGRNSIEEMTEAAKAAGYEYIAICDHSPGLGIAGGLSEERLMEKIEFVRELNESLEKITVLAGTEVDIRADGRLDYSDEVLARCDVVVAAIHSAHNQKSRTMTNRIITAVENENVDIIAHPTGRIIGVREPYDVDMGAVLEAAARTGTVMEINAYPARLDLNDRWARICKEMGVKLAINTDAHSVQGLDVMKYGVKTARRGWLEKVDVVNALGLGALREIFQS